MLRKIGQPKDRWHPSPYRTRKGTKSGGKLHSKRGVKFWMPCSLRIGLAFHRRTLTCCHQGGGRKHRFSLSMQQLPKGLEWRCKTQLLNSDQRKEIEQSRNSRLQPSLVLCWGIALQRQYHFFPYCFQFCPKRQSADRSEAWRRCGYCWGWWSMLLLLKLIYKLHRLSWARSSKTPSIASL